MDTAPAGTPLAVATRNFPYLFDLFLGVDHVTGPRFGLPFDALLEAGSAVTFFAGRYHLVVDIHPLRAFIRWLRRSAAA